MTMGGAFDDYGTDVATVAVRDPMSRSELVGVRLIALGDTPVDPELLGAVRLRWNEDSPPREKAIRAVIRIVSVVRS